MRLIVITPEIPLHCEAETIAAMLDEGVDRVHLRHPSMTDAAMEGLIASVPARLRARLSLHDHHRLAAEAGCGIHLNGRNPSAPEDFGGIVSRSCHSIAEASVADGTDYRFISPVFDSVSKPGYASAFTLDELRRAFDDRLLDDSVVALGGVAAENLGKLRLTGFSRAAMLGAAWRGDGVDEILKNLRPILTSLRLY